MQRLDIGDQVRITGEGTDNEGATGYLAHVDSGALYYVAISSGDDLYGPYTRGDLSAIKLCEWFLMCTREAVGTVSHPIIGDVPVCGPCMKFAQPDSYLD